MPPVFEGRIAGLVASTSGQVVILGILVCLTGIAMCGVAGMGEKELSEAEKRASIAEFNFTKGAWVAVFAGIMSSCMAFAFAAGKPIAEAAVEAGARPIFQNFPVLIVALFGGFTTNFVWCAALSFKNRSWRDYRRVRAADPAGAARGASAAPAKPMPSLLANYVWAALAGTTWYFSSSSTAWARPRWASTISPAGRSTWPSSSPSAACGGSTSTSGGDRETDAPAVVAGIAVLILSTVVVGVGDYLATRPAAPARGWRTPGVRSASWRPRSGRWPSSSVRPTRPGPSPSSGSSSGRASTTARTSIASSGATSSRPGAETRPSCRRNSTPGRTFSGPGPGPDGVEWSGDSESTSALPPGPTSTGSTPSSAGSSRAPTPREDRRRPGRGEVGGA